MLEDFYSAPFALARFRKGPGGPYLDDFSQWLARRQYKPFTTKFYIRQAAQFMIWAKTQGMKTESLCQSDLDAYHEHIKSLGRHGKGGRGSIDYAAARRFVAFLHHGGVIVGIGRRKSEEIPLLEEFRRTLRLQRGLVEKTIEGYSRVIHDFIETMGQNPEDYDAKRIRIFVVDRVGRHGPGYAEKTVTSVRHFIRFLIAMGRLPSAFEHLIPRVAKWRLSRLPQYMQPEDIEKVIESCDPSTHLGARDYAVVLLLARLALRAGDIARLKLSDLEWSMGTFRVAGKSRSEVRLPLPQDVGDAILAYLETWRPESMSDYVFLLSRPPHGPIASHIVSQIARRAIIRAEVVAPSRGAHIFRHSAATAMLRQGATLQAIGGILRHNSIETTTHYAKVDKTGLAELARPWPGEMPC